MKEQEIINEALAKVTEEWAKKYLENRIAFLRRKNAVSTGELVNSFGQEVTANAGQFEVTALIAFSEQGRYIDLKKFDHDKWGRNAVARIEDWVKRRGAEKFVPGFLQTYKLKAPPRDLLNRIAWGILVNRSKGKFRRQNWYARSKSGAITDLYNEVAITNMNATADALKFNFTQYARSRGRQ